MPTVIQVEEISKRYRLGVLGGGTLREDLNRWWARRRGRPDPSQKVGAGTARVRSGDEIWALRDVSFEVAEGEILGIIGRNGAGKSTLLKILSRITAPTSGRAVLRGRVGSLLEVGTGFHPELTGRENVYLNGTILGMTKAEVDRKLDEIVEFSEISQFVDTPVKRYSSGMTVRLAFAVAAHLEPEILIVDEVLAVGDAAFQRKSLGKLQSVSAGGRTVLFVSHNLGALTRLCSRAIWIHEGKLVAGGDPAEIVRDYLATTLAPGEANGAGATVSRLLSEVRTLGADGKPTQIFDFGSAVRVRIAYADIGSVAKTVLAVRVTNSDGTTIFTSWDTDSVAAERPAAGAAECVIPPRLLRPGDYTLRVMAVERAHSQLTLLGEVGLGFQISGVGFPMNESRVGLIAPVLAWSYQATGAGSVCVD
jgi:lipopolysaccharide transport system ATP-binding protein